jgi:ferredoxin-thioredoxin reductase catalytic chain
MSEEYKPTDQETEELRAKLEREAESSGYHLNPDPEFSGGLAESLLINQKRYGYMACPCRLASGEREKDTDIICPCDYRDADLEEFGACYCALYVSQDVLTGKITIRSIPERRGKEKAQEKAVTEFRKFSLPVWRCKVCGYLCARDNPPEKCPICKAGKDRFERFA